MADLLAHVLFALTVFTIAGWWLDWLAPRWIVVAIGGAIVPDLNRLALVIEPTVVEGLTGVPFGFGALATIGGLALAAGVVTVWFPREHWPRIYGLLVAGGLTHLLLDGLRVYADGRAGSWLFPLLPAYRPPTPNLYVSTDPAVTAVAIVVAAAVVTVDRWVVADGVW